MARRRALDLWREGQADNVPLGTAKSRIRLGMAKLRTEMELAKSESLAPAA